MAWVSDESIAGLNVDPRAIRASACVFKEELINDSNKTFDLTRDSTAGPILAFHVTGIRMRLVTDATSGTRQMSFRLIDQAGQKFYQHDFHTDFDVPASTTQHFNLGIGLPQVTAGVGVEARDTLPNHLWMRPDWRIHFIEANAISATGDDLVLFVLGIMYWL